jgi:hypothetical protein
MRKLILTAAAALTLLIAPTASAVTVHAEDAAGSRGHVLRWSLDYDTVTDDLVVNITHTKFDGSAAIGDPQVANLILVRPNGQERTFNLLTVNNPVDGQPGILNDGPLTYPNIATRVSPRRSQLIEFRTEYTPPVGA